MKLKLISQAIKSLSPVSTLVIHTLQLNLAKKGAGRENANLLYCGLFSDALTQSIRSNKVPYTVLDVFVKLVNKSIISFLR